MSIMIHTFYTHIHVFIYSMFVGTMGIPRQTDIKRLVAWCTVQEMSFILMFWGLKQTYLNKTYLIFIIIHGLFSAYMFFLVDIIQKRYKTRNMSAISGINILSPQLTKYIWFLMFSFSGFPLTAKFVVEWNFFALLSYHGFIFYLIVAFGINIFSILFLSKIIFTLLYGTPRDIVESMTIDIQKRELIILNTLVYSILMLTLLIYII
jgi:formate hydrogenlyase subunit 3/multisubunit Na+/H+ antiporter MnhD subunit